MNKENNICFDDENLLLYYMQKCNKYEEILTEIKNVIEHNDLEWGTKSYDYVMSLLNKCDIEN